MAKIAHVLNEFAQWFVIVLLIAILLFDFDVPLIPRKDSQRIEKVEQELAESHKELAIMQVELAELQRKHVGRVIPLQ